MQIVEDRAPNGFNQLHDVISQTELEEIAARYKRIAGFEKGNTQSKTINMKPPGIEFAFEINVQVTAGKIQEVGETGKGIRRVVPITGGSFEGPGISGQIVPGGYDWQLLRSDGVSEIDARYLLLAEDGTLITIENKGLRHGPAEIMERIARGEEVNEGDYYFRSVPVFETSNKKYEWLTKNIFIATGIRKPDKVLISVWKVI